MSELLFILINTLRISACLKYFSDGVGCIGVRADVFVCLFIGIGIGFRLWLFNQPWLDLQHTHTTKHSFTRCMSFRCVCVCVRMHGSSSFTNFTVQLGTSGSKAIYHVKDQPHSPFCLFYCDIAVPKTTTPLTQNIIIPIIIVNLKTRTHSM